MARPQQTAVFTARDRQPKGAYMFGRQRKQVREAAGENRRPLLSDRFASVTEHARNCAGWNRRSI